MRIAEQFRSISRETLRQADRLARMRDADIQGTRMAGSDATGGTYPGSVNFYGRWGRTAWGEFHWR